MQGNERRKSMNYKELIVESGKKLIHDHLTVETWGNISVRDKETGYIYLSPSAMDYDQIVEDDIIVCDRNGTTIEGHRKPTVEKDLHILVYQHRPDVNAVLHTHSLHATAFACLGATIPMFLEEAAQVFGTDCRTAKYALPGSMELAENCVETLGEKSMCCLLKSHGTLCIGEDIKAAFKVAKVLEVTADLYQMILAMGKKPDPISDENIAAMQEFFKYSYRQ